MSLNTWRGQNKALIRQMHYEESKKKKGKIGGPEKVVSIA